MSFVCWLPKKVLSLLWSIGGLWWVMLHNCTSVCLFNHAAGVLFYVTVSVHSMPIAIFSCWKALAFATAAGWPATSQQYCIHTA